ncbi:hypothetical protein [uncultured Maribacter sp.]|jgi:hypothetical protein|uniref:hypothetical protein n=1 Tax=uncultured Maribacter sp. TaxID=431308 RepID=UPI002602B6C0|nr:hypothetical protein [uncultured Maribacter sp.]
MKILKVHSKFIYLSLFLIGFIFNSNAQKASGFYEKMREFSYPFSPAPSGVTYYKMDHDLKSGSITMKDYRGEIVTIDNFNHKRPTYHPNYKNYSNPLSVLQKYDERKSTKSNTIFYNLKSSNIELYYKKGETDTIYDVYANFTASYNAKYDGNTIAKDSLIFNDKVGEIVSKLNGKDFAIVAVNKSKNVAYDANDNVLVTVHNAYQGFIRRAQLSYGKKNMAFIKLKKTKKLNSADEVNTLTEAIRNLKNIDTGLKARSSRNEEVQRLIEKFTSLIDSEDYKENDDYKVFVHGNLGSFYSLLEDFKKAIAQYDLGTSFSSRGGLSSYMSDGKKKAQFKMQRKAILFSPGENTVKPEYSDKYNTFYQGK